MEAAAVFEDILLLAKLTVEPHQVLAAAGQIEQTVMAVEMHSGGTLHADARLH